jgi:hypothetical protein
VCFYQYAKTKGKADWASSKARKSNGKTKQAIKTETIKEIKAVHREELDLSKIPFNG